MILIDTSVWIDHFRLEEPVLRHNLINGNVLMHDLVLGELSMGNFAQRSAKLENLHEMARCIVGAVEDAYVFVERNRLFGHGIGFTDARLLLACKLTPGLLLWTRDRRLTAAAAELDILAPLH